MTEELEIPSVERDFTVKDYIPGQPIPVLLKDPRTGQTFVNPLKKWVKPFTLVTEPAAITLAANEQSQFFPMTLDAKGHFEIFSAYFVSQRTEGFTVEIFNPAEMSGMGALSPAPRPMLMNREVHVATIASGDGTTLNYETLAAGGNAGRPFRWPTTHWVNVDEGAKCLLVRFRNLSSSSNAIRFALHGLRWYHTMAPDRVAERMQEIYRGRFRVMPYFYTTDDFILMAGSATATPFVRFDDVSWTEVHKLMRFSTNRFNCRIVETTTGKRFMESEIRDDLVFGDGEFPFLCWEPWLFEPNYKLRFELTNLSGSNNTVWLTMACRKLLFDPQDRMLLRPSQSPGVFR